jgi:molybdate transport system substrate-binding protein
MPTLNLLSGGAADGLVRTLAPAFEGTSGCAIEGVFGAVGAMREKLRSGHPADVVILTRAIVDQLAREGDVLPDTIADLGMVETAVAIRTGDPVPDVHDAETLAETLRGADEIHFPDPTLATAGVHFASVLNRLGVADALRPALRAHPNGMTAMRALAASTARRPVGCTQVTEIIVTPGVSLVSALPKGLDLSTTYTAAVCAGSPNSDHARAFVAHLTSTDASAQRRGAGFGPVT